MLKESYFLIVKKNIESTKLSRFLRKKAYELDALMAMDSKDIQNYYSQHKIQRLSLVSHCLSLIDTVNSSNIKELLK